MRGIIIYGENIFSKIFILTANFIILLAWPYFAMGMECARQSHADQQLVRILPDQECGSINSTDELIIKESLLKSYHTEVDWVESPIPPTKSCKLATSLLGFLYKSRLIIEKDEIASKVLIDTDFGDYCLLSPAERGQLKSFNFSRSSRTQRNRVKDNLSNCGLIIYQIGKNINNKKFLAYYSAGQNATASVSHVSSRYAEITVTNLSLNIGNEFESEAKNNLQMIACQ